MHIFIPTNSADGTCDILVESLKEKGVSVFRWNVDLWRYYEIEVDDQHITFSDPAGRKLNLLIDDVYLLWRKPFIEQVEELENDSNEGDKKFLRSQIHQILLLIVSAMSKRNRVVLVEPYADRRLPKLFQLQTASKYFQVPAFAFSIQKNILPDPIITKPMGSSLVGSKILYTTKVPSLSLKRPFAWFVQTALVGGTDVTAVYIDGDVYFYECEFSRDDQKIDWRREINAPNQSAWKPLQVDEGPKISTKALMTEFNLKYGRLDFIKLDDVLWFLECNSNGQFGWLDDESFALHDRFAAAAIAACETFPA